MDKKIAGFKENLSVIRHFRPTFAALADERVLRLLASLDSDALDNSEVRAVLGPSRKAAWLLLVRLVDLGVIQRRGHSYAISSTTYDLTNSFALALRGLVNGRAALDSSLSALLASEGHEFIQWAYAKGKINMPQLLEYEKQLKESGKEETALGR